MARARKKWSALKTEILRRLRESQNSTLFTADLVLDLWNQCKDYREMQLQESHEGYGVKVFEADLVAQQSMYEIPEDAGRFKRVVRVYPDQNRERPLIRRERFMGGMSTDSAQGFISGTPTYRIVGNFIKLEPAPIEDVTDGLKIEMEQVSDEFSGADNDALPIDWPIFAENLLVLDTVIACFEHEDSLGLTEAEAKEALVRPVEKSRARYEAMWDNYIERRSFGRTFAQPYRQGA